MRWLWIDRFVAFESGRFARAVKNVSMAEEQLRDHLPGYPLMPNSLVIEGLAQTGGILVGEAQDFKKMVVLAKLSHVAFTGKAVPGDELTYEARIIEMREEGSEVEATALVNGRPLATAVIVFGNVDRSGDSEVIGRRYAAYRDELTQLLGVPPRAPGAVEASGGNQLA